MSSYLALLLLAIGLMGALAAGAHWAIVLPGLAVGVGLTAVLD